MASSGNIRMAVRNLRRNRTRSLLTMLGVIIGVVSVVLIVGIGEGIKHQLGSQTARLGRDLIIVRPGQSLAQSGSGILANLLVPPGGTLSDTDTAAIARTPGVSLTVPMSVVRSSIGSSERSKPLNFVVLGTQPAFVAIMHQTLSFGAFLSDESSMADKVVLGSKAASALFDERVPLGQTVSILGHQFIVMGVFDDFSASPLGSEVDFNNAVFISYASAQAITHNSSPIYEILVRPSDQHQTDALIDRLRAKLLAAHGGQNDFSVVKQSDAAQTTSQTLGLLTAMISGVAAISLLVGGVGIMNVMLVSVTERMHEVGIRKALGATNRQIMTQFVTEAAVLSLAGGFIGLLVAFITAGAIALATDITPIITWQIVALVTVVSVAVGVIFGSIPALKAARKDPIAALRNE